MTSRPRARRTVSPLLIALALAIALAGLIGAAFALRSSDDDAPILSPGSTYTEAVVGTWERVNPVLAPAGSVDEDLSRLVFSGLLRHGPDGGVEPGLADLPAISEGGRTLTFTIREGARWHDGEPVTAADVAFTIAQVTSPGFRGPSELATIWSNIEVSTPSEQTVVFRLPEPSAPFLARHATIGILPSHLLDGASADDLFDSGFNESPVGTGPYVLTSLSSSRATLRAFGDYLSGQPAIETLHIDFYTDVSSALRAVESGSADAVYVTQAEVLANSLLIESLEDVEIQRPVDASYLALYLNTSSVLFNDERVRRAIALTIDAQSIVSDVFGDAALRSSSPVAPTSWAYVEEHDQSRTDIEEARSLLDDAEWLAHPASGIRTKLGSELRFTIRTDTDPSRIAVAERIAADLEQVGIRANVASTTFSVLRRDFLQERRYEAAVATWAQGLDPDPYFGWHSSQGGSAGLNISNISNAVLDRLIEEGRTDDRLEVRRDVYAQLQQVWQELVPSVIVAYPRGAFVHRGGVDPILPVLMERPADRFQLIHQWRAS